jgi:hypothetical protein
VDNGVSHGHVPITVEERRRISELWKDVRDGYGPNHDPLTYRMSNVEGRVTQIEKARELESTKRDARANITLAAVLSCFVGIIIILVTHR